jgi:hypothetical protein
MAPIRIHPIAAPMSEVALTLACGIVALLLLLPNRSGLIVRGRGFLLLMLYVGFVWATAHFLISLNMSLDPDTACMRAPLPKSFTRSGQTPLVV